EKQEKVNKAIERGVEFLKKTQAAHGGWNDHGGRVGASALPGLTLLECGVPAKDAAVQAAARYVRDRCKTLNQTYDRALAVLFLDRLGDPADRALIRTLALRLVAGQLPGGGWSYHCQPLSESNEQDLLTALELTRPDEQLVSIGRLG